MHTIHSLPRDERAESRAVAIVRAGSDWLCRQGQVHGYAPETATLTIGSYDTVEIPRTGGAAIFGRMAFEGVLTVIDPERFIKAVTQGFGRARAFGCGLMLLRRV